MCVKVYLRLSKTNDRDIILCKAAGIKIQNIITIGIKNALGMSSKVININDVISQIKNGKREIARPEQIGYTTSDPAIIKLLNKYSEIPECSLGAVLKAYFRTVIQLPPDIVYGIDIKADNALHGETQKILIQNIISKPSSIKREQKSVKKENTNKEILGISEKYNISDDDLWDESEDLAELEKNDNENDQMSEEEMLRILESL